MNYRLSLCLICAASMTLVACDSKKPEAAKPTSAPKVEPAKPAEEKPVDARPAEVKPAETKPTEPPAPPPAETKPAQPAPAAPQSGEKPGPPITKDNGLIIEDITIGTGAVVTEGAGIVFHYRGTLKSDGTEFESNFNAEPAAYGLAELVQGWQQGIPGMKIGGTRKLTIPWQLAYGEAGGGKIPPKADLIFDIKVVDMVRTEDIKIGDGAVCQPGQTVTVMYTGTFASDGKLLDTNVGGEPLVRPLAGLVRGWQFGVPGMMVGGKRKLFIPYQFAYGERGRPPRVPPKSDLVFEIELLGVK
jgi:peptidylprolyl isomerase